MTKKILLALLLAVGAATSSFASGGELVLDRFPADRAKSLPALQNGAKLFVNYCLNCHAAGYMRFNRMRDIGLSDDQIRDNLIFGNKKVGDLMTVTMNPVQAKAWFGVVPPDLTVVARSRASGAGSGADYLYT